MSAVTLEQIPAARRNELFHAISDLVSEAGAIDRALEHTGEGWSVDDTLEAIVDRIDEELKMARKGRRLAKILRMDLRDGAGDAA